MGDDVDDDSNESTAAASKAPSEASSSGANRPLEEDDDHRWNNIPVHRLSYEQLIHYQELTTALVGGDEERRAAACGSLAADPAILAFVPNLIAFLSGGLEQNLLDRDLRHIAYLLRGIKSLLDNEAVFLEAHIHELIPDLVSVCVVDELGAPSDAKLQWNVRRSAAQILGACCRRFSNAANRLSQRILRLLMKNVFTIQKVENSNSKSPKSKSPSSGPRFPKLDIDSEVPWATYSGTVRLILELPDEIRDKFFEQSNHIRNLSRRIQTTLSNSSFSPDLKLDCEQLKADLVAYLPSLISKSYPYIGETEEWFERTFRFLGADLLKPVAAIRRQLFGEFELKFVEENKTASESGGGGPEGGAGGGVGGGDTKETRDESGAVELDATDDKLCRAICESIVD